MVIKTFEKIGFSTNIAWSLSYDVKDLLNRTGLV